MDTSPRLSRGVNLLGVMIKFFWLTLRPVERFLAQWRSVSTEPRTFVRERIRLAARALLGAKSMRKSSNIFVSALALGLAMFVPLSTRLASILNQMPGTHLGFCRSWFRRFLCVGLKRGT